MLGLLHMALSHVRNLEIFALLLPLVVLAPVASQFALQARARSRERCPGGRAGAMLAAARRLDLAAGGQTGHLRRLEASRRRRPSMR